MNEIKVEPCIGSIPEIKTQYWYVQSSLAAKGCFRVVETEWIGGMSDSLRLAKGNVFLTQKEADQVCDQLNERYDKIRDTIDTERQKERIAEEAARKKAEAALRKAEREKKAKLEEKSKTILSAEEKKVLRKEGELKKFKAYERSKKKRQAKSPHPDIIV